MLPGQLFDGPGQLQSDRPEQIRREFAHLVSVALGKWLVPHRASPYHVAGKDWTG